MNKQIYVGLYLYGFNSAVVTYIISIDKRCCFYTYAFGRRLKESCPAGDLTTWVKEVTPTQVFPTFIGFKE